MSLMDVINDVVNVINFSVGKAGSASQGGPESRAKLPVPVRMICLAPLCRLRLNVHLDEVLLSVLSEERTKDRPSAAELLKTLAGSAQSQGAAGRASSVISKHISLQLRMLGLSKKYASSLVADYLQSMASRSIDASTNVVQNLQHALDSLTSARFSSDGTRPVPILSLMIINSSLSVHSLMYDYRVSFFIEELLLVDHTCYPILHLSPPPLEVKHKREKSFDSSQSASFPDKKIRIAKQTSFITAGSAMHNSGSGQRTHFAPRESKLDLSRRRVERELEALEGKALLQGAFCLTYTEQDKNNGWGVGGHRVDTLYQNIRPDHYSVREGSVTLKIWELSLVLVPSTIMRIANKFLPAFYRTLAYWDVSRRKYTMAESDGRPPDNNLDSPEYIESLNTKKTMDSIASRGRRTYIHEIEVNRTFDLCDEGLTIVAVCDSRLLAIAASNQCLATFEISSPRTKKEQRIFRASVATLEVHDLTPVGSLHPQVIWNHPKLHTNAVSLYVAIGKTKTICDVKAYGIRCCILFRFVKEINAFVMDHILMPLSAILRGDTSPVDFCHTDSSSEGSIHTVHSSCEAYDAIGEPTVFSPAFSRAATHILEEMQNGLRKTRAGPMSATSHCAAESNEFIWSLAITNSTLIFPRNSFSDDLVCATIGELRAKDTFCATSWVAPTHAQRVDSVTSGPLYFDVEAGCWRTAELAPTLTDAALALLSTPKNVPSQLSVIFSNDDFDSASSPMSTATYSSRPPMAPDSSKSFAVASTTAEQMVDTEGEAQYGEDDSEFHDALEGPPTTVGREFRMSTEENLRTSGVRGQEDSPSEIGSEDQNVQGRRGPIRRIILDLSEVLLYASVAGPLAGSDSAASSFTNIDEPQLESLRCFLEVKNESLVYSPTVSSRNAPSRQQWKKLTITPFEGLLVADVSDSDTRILFSEKETESPFDVDLSMGQYGLCLSILYDNSFECAQDFLLTHSASRYRSTQSTKSQSTWPPYGSVEYCNSIRSSYCSWEFIMIRMRTNLTAYLDSDYNSNIVPSAEYLDSKKTSDDPTRINSASWQHKIYPFAAATMLRGVLHMKGGPDATQISIGAGGLELRDLRNSVSSLFSVVLRALPDDVARDNRAHDDRRSLRTSVQSCSDFDFGLMHGPSCLNSPQEQPFKLTIFATTNNWMMINVGVDHPDIIANNLEIVHIISDCFSMFFRRPEFGHPGVAAYYMRPDESWPYGGRDTRVFVFRPHCSIVENPMMQRPQELMLESSSGVYYRYMYDRRSSVTIECTLFDIAAVLMKTYRPPASARGLRGSSGSGRGVRTLIEYFNAQYAYHQVLPENLVDIAVCIGPLDPLGINYKSADKDKPQDGECRCLDHEAFSLKPVHILEPKCVFAPADPARNVSSSSCDLVSSLEDILLASVLFCDVWGINLMKRKANSEVSSYRDDE